MKSTITTGNGEVTLSITCENDVDLAQLWCILNTPWQSYVGNKGRFSPGVMKKMDFDDQRRLFKKIDHEVMLISMSYSIFG